MWIWWLRTRPRRRRVRDGYFFCRGCLGRTPGEMFVVENVLYLFGLLPVSTGEESRTHLECLRCGRDFEESGDWPFDFGDHAQPKLWDCRQCGTQNTSERLRCSSCGRHI